MIDGLTDHVQAPRARRSRSRISGHGLDGDETRGDLGFQHGYLRLRRRGAGRRRLSLVEPQPGDFEDGGTDVEVRACRLILVAAGGDQVFPRPSNEDAACTFCDMPTCCEDVRCSG
jgi:hypothetical protein